MIHAPSLHTRLAGLALSGVIALALSACGDQAPQNAVDMGTAASGSSIQAAPAAEGRFVIHGNLPKVEDGTPIKLNMFVGDGSGDGELKTVASTTVENGRFTLSGPVERPTEGFLLLGNGGTRHLIVSDAKFELVQTGAGYAVKGGKINDLVYGYERDPAYVKALAAKNRVYHEQFDGLDESDEAAMTAARKAMQPYNRKVRELKNAYQADILDGDQPALDKLFVLAGNYDWKRYSPEQRKQMLDAYQSEIGDHPLLLRMRASAEENEQSAAVHAKLTKGKPYRDVVATDKDGKSLKLSDVLAENRLVLLDFWASWCGPCRGEFPHLSKVYREFHDDGFEIYAVSLDEDRGEWLKALEEEGTNGHIPWINLRDGGMDAASARTYAVLGLPSNYLIDHDGTIVGVNMREWDVERAVRDAVKKLDAESGS